MYTPIHTSLPRAAFLAAGLALAGLAPAHAGEAQLDALASAPAHDRFIVTYRPGGQRLADAQRRDAVLASAAASVPPRRGAVLQVQRLRTMATGPEVVGASRALDRAEAEILMRNLAADPDVLRVEVDQLLEPAATTNDPELRYQWQFGTTPAAINIQPAWDLSRGEGSVIAIVDTGVYRHPDLVANLLPGYDFITDPVSGGDGDGRDGDANDVGTWTRVGECSAYDKGSYSDWHGTQVAGVAGASTNNSLGMAGTAYNAKILPVRVMGKCGARTSDVLDAIVWSAGGSVPGVPANVYPAEAINVSLSGSGQCSASYQEAINRAVTLGATVVVAAGNRSSEVSGALPANCQNVIAVAASTSTGRKSTASNYGDGIDVTAPGQDVLTTRVSGATEAYGTRYSAEHGTSLAAPHVAGVIALMQSAAAQPLAPGRIEQILKDTARPMPVACPLGCGAGLLDAGAAVAAARKEGGGAPVAPPPAPVPRSLSFTGLSAATGTELVYEIEVPAGRTLTVRIQDGTGDADLYLGYGSLPTDTRYLCRPYVTGNRETCTIANAQGGRYFIRVKAYRAVAGMSLTASA